MEKSEKSSAIISKSLLSKSHNLKVTHNYGKLVYNVPITRDSGKRGIRNKQLSLKTILRYRRLYCNALQVSNIIFLS